MVYEPNKNNKENIMNTKECVTVWSVLICAAACHDARAANISAVNRFKDEDRLNVYLRAVHIDTQAKNNLIENRLGGLPAGGHFGGTAVGAIVDYNSKYYADVIGFDASLYGVAPIESQDSSQELLDDRHGHNEGFFKVGQSYLKVRHLDETWSADMQLGRGRFDAGTIESLDTRVVPETYQGARSHLTFTDVGIGPLPGKLVLESAFIDQASPRDRGEFIHLRSEGKAPIDNVYTYGINYNLKALEFGYVRGVAKDYNENTGYTFIARMPLGKQYAAILDVSHYRFKRAGAVWDQDWRSGHAAYDDHASWTNLNVGFRAGKLLAGISYAKANAKLSNGKLGYAYFYHGADVSGASNVWTRSGNDFNNDGEHAWQLAAEYDLAGLSLFGVPLEGFKAAALFKRGTFDAQNPFDQRVANVKERQNEYRLYYRFDEEHRSGLSVGIIYTDYHINEDFVAVISAQPDNVLTGKELRTYIDYAF